MNPTMNMQKVAKCMKTGKSRKECMAAAYPEKGGKSGKKSSKKSSGRKPAY